MKKFNIIFFITLLFPLIGFTEVEPGGWTLLQLLKWLMEIKSILCR